jgi:segregation and condensation protein B
MTESSQPDNADNLPAELEALLFVASGAVTPAQLAAAVEKPAGEVEEALRGLDERNSQSGGLSLQWHAGPVQLTTAPRMGALVERFLGLEATSRQSRAALEALAIVAYQQPVTRPQMDNIRGVSSDGVLKSLLSKGLVQEVGRAEGPGRPIMYGTTSEFLQHFGLTSLTNLPPLDTYEAPAAPPENGGLLKD